ncbi:MAG: metallophosphoesterase [Planctomycetes bacterium]|nr:metallophosphoesterase [Planctomycetota bacterium]
MLSTLLLVGASTLAPAHDGHEPPRKHPARHDPARFLTSRRSPIQLPLPSEEDAFFFAIFGDRTGGPAEGVKVLAEAVADVNLLEPDLVMTVGDLVQGYNETPEWLLQMTEFKGIMNRLKCPWFPVVGNHDLYWRGRGQPPEREHEASYEAHFGPLWYAFRHKGAWFLALHSDETSPETGEKRFDDPAHQRMSPEQFAWLVETLQRTREAEHVFVFLHHPRWLRGGYGDDWDRVHALLAGAGNVKAVFAGHIHRMRYDGLRDGIEYFALATTGGGQDGWAPEAGYLHEYHVVTVRKSGIAVASFPVGAAMDPRAITGALSDDVRDLARALEPRWEGRGAFTPGLGVEGALVLEVRNPARRPVEFTLTPASADARWIFTPDHAHATVQPGQSARFELRLGRPEGTLDEAFRVPLAHVQADYLGETLRVPLPRREWAVPLDLARLPLPPRPEQEGVLALDGEDDALLVAPDDLDVPDGPFTIEGWLNAREFRRRQGFLCRTEGSEYGLFVNDGKPEFSVHLGGRYTTAQTREPRLVPGTWHHVAGVFDGAEVRVYVDGAQVARRQGSGRRTRNALPFVIGGDVGQGGLPNSFFPGEIDEVRVSRVARYAGERCVPTRRFEADADTLLLLHMDGKSGPWFPDASGRAAHATASGSPRLEAR